MFINDSVLTVTCGVNIFAASILGVSDISLPEAGIVSISFMAILYVVNKVFTHLNKSNSEAAKLDAIYHRLIVNDIELILKCDHKEKCPLYHRLIAEVDKVNESEKLNDK